MKDQPKSEKKTSRAEDLIRKAFVYYVDHIYPSLDNKTERGFSRQITRWKKQGAQPDLSAILRMYEDARVPFYLAFPATKIYANILITGSEGRCKFGLDGMKKIDPSLPESMLESLDDLPF